MSEYRKNSSSEVSPAELLDRFNDLKLVDYGFVYRGDPLFTQDNITLFLLEKANA